MIVISLSCAFLLGTLFGWRFSLPLPAALVALTPLLLLQVRPVARKTMVLVTLGLVAFMLGALHAASVRSSPADHHLSSYNDREYVDLRGIVSRDPEATPTTARLRVSVSEIRSDGGWRDVSGTALLYLPRYPEYHYGDFVVARGILEATLLQGPDGSDWTGPSDYRGYLVSQGIHSVMFYPEVEVLDSGRGSSLLAWIYEVRSQMSGALAAVLPEPQAALSQSIVLGLRTAMPADLKEDFSTTGTTHLLAISGVNLTIVAGMLVTMAVALFGRRYHLYIWLTLGTVWFYALLTGLQPPVLRAAVMLSVFLAASVFGRQRSGVIALFLSAAILVAFSPTIIRDPSFQLSFAAMAGMVFICPPLQSLVGETIRTVMKEGKIRTSVSVLADSLVISLGAVIAVWPLIAFYFGIVSWAGVPATVAALPAMPAIIMTGITSACLGAVFLTFGQLIGWLAWVPLSYLLLVVTAFASVPGVSMETGPIGQQSVAAYYVILATLLGSWHHRAKLLEMLPKAVGFMRGLPWKWVVASFGLLSIAVWLVAATIPDSNLHVSFLDVGQGDAVLIERGHQQILVDGGPDPGVTLLELAGKMPFWDRTIDAIILTHPHADHLTGLVEVVRRYRVKRVLSPGLSGDSALFDQWQRLIDERDIGHDVVTRGYSIGIGGDVTLTVLNPGPGLEADSKSFVDDNSIVLRVDAGRVGFLLTGDITREAEMAMIAARPGLDTTVLKVSHHGSAMSTCEGFLGVVSPEVAVISVGANNGYGHPNGAVVDRLAARTGAENVFRTDEHGTIEFVTDGERLWVRSGGR